MVAINDDLSATVAGGSAFKYSQGAVLTPSSSTITPTDPLHHVAAGTISTIATTNLDTSMANELVLVANGTVTFATGGNISTQTTSLGANSLIRFVLDGSTWREDATAIAGLFLNVKDFGAKGDSVTDDYTAIQAALTAASTAGGATVFIPAGTYRISSPVKVGNNTIVCGVGAASIIQRGSGADIYLLGNLDITSTGNQKITLRDFTLDGARNNTTNNASKWNLYFSYVTNFTIERVRFIRGRSDGCAIEYGLDFRITDCEATECSKPGFYLSASDRGILERNVSHDNTGSLAAGYNLGYSWHIEMIDNIGYGNELGDIIAGRDSRYCTFIGNQMESFVGVDEAVTGTTPYLTEHQEEGGPASYNGVTTFGISNCKIVNNTFTKSTVLAGIQIVKGDNNEITGNTVGWAQKTGITIQGATNTKIRGNQIFNCGQATASTYFGINISGTGSYAAPTGTIVERNHLYDDQGAPTMLGIVTSADADQTIIFRQNTNTLTNSISVTSPTTDEWTNVSLSAGDFTASTGTWTNVSPVTWAYRIREKEMQVIFLVASTSVSATPATLSIAIPGGRTSSKRTYAVGSYSDNGGAITSDLTAQVTASGSTIQLQIGHGAANWSTSVTATRIELQMSFPIT